MYGLDSEMVYTVWGPALSRLSVVDMRDDLVLDVLVRPSATIVDTNSRFSGLTEEQLLKADCDFVQAWPLLFSYSAIS